MSRKNRLKALAAFTLATGAISSIVWAQGEAQDDPVAEYRAMMGDDNPAEFWVMRGEALWATPRGPNKTSFEKCDLGFGPGVVEGAYAQLPRYFEDAGQVMDLETRLLHCMTTQQGIAREEAVKQRFGDGAKESDFEALAAYVAEASRGTTLQVPLDNPAMKKAYALGRQIFFHRSGPHDFACATCHGQTGVRIRLQQLPNITEADGAREAYSGWPAYRVSQGEVRTMQWRLQDCFRQQRLPQLEFGSEASIALTTYIAHNADGGVMDAPGMKR